MDKMKSFTAILKPEYNDEEQKMDEDSQKSMSEQNTKVASDKFISSIDQPENSVQWLLFNSKVVYTNEATFDN